MNKPRSRLYIVKRYRTAFATFVEYKDYLTLKLDWALQHNKEPDKSLLMAELRGLTFCIDILQNIADESGAGSD